MPRYRCRTPQSAAVLVLSLLAVCLVVAPPAHAQTGTTSVTLVWTATGDDGLVGQASHYDLRISSTADPLRPRQVRYQAALRPDMTSRIDSKALPNFLPPL